jgi:hypothetical protein
MNNLQRRYLPVPLSRARINLHGIPKGYPGTRKTLDYIQSMVRQGAKDFDVRQKAIDILMQSGVPPKDYLGEIKALFEWVQQNVRYTKDPYRVEVLHSARRMLELRAGDCDDMTILLASMLEAIGHPTRLVIIGPTPLQPDLFSHIYLEANCKGRWISLDPTMPFPVGWAPKGYVKQVISIDRRNPKMFGDIELQGTQNIPMAAGWLQSLAGVIAGGALPRRDPRIKRLYDLLVQRQLWGRSPRMQRVLRFAWKNGLADRQRPRTGQWFSARLRRWGLLPGQPAAGPVQYPAPWAARRPFRRVGLRPVGLRRVSMRPVSMRPVSVRPVSVSPTGFRRDHRTPSRARR